MNDDAPPPHAFDERPHRWSAGLLATASGGLVFLILGGLLGLLVITQDLPELRSLDDYHPPQATVVYGAGGEVVGRFAKERRTVVSFDQIPKIMVEAVVASEDAAFFEHEGVDLFGIARCVVKNVLSGRKRCGGSTITQQTVKTFFLTPEKTYVRKLRELVLAKRVEEALSKEDILFLYLNQIYFGHGAYGVQEASRIYFGKDIGEIDVAQAALLAGLPQSPSRLDPYRHPERARKRRAYVLGRLLELGKIDLNVHETALEAPFDLAWDTVDVDLDNGSHFMAHVKRLLLEDPAVGEEQLLTGGLSVHTGLDPSIQASADTALEAGVEAIDKRQGWRGPLRHLEPPEARALKEVLRNRLEDVRSGKTPDPKEPPIIWDLSAVVRAPENLPASDLAQLARTPRFEIDRAYAGIVSSVQDPARRAVVSLGSIEVVLPLRSGLGWARPFSVDRWTAAPRRPSDVLRPGDIVLVRALDPVDGGRRRYTGLLEQSPLAQAAVVVIDPSTREVRALSGGYGTGAGTFNRAVQARRQAGSTFKPIVYATAFETKKFTPVSTCLDAPRVYRDKWTGKTWKPQNYSGTFDGEISLRRALTLSKNLCSVELIDKVGVESVRKMAQRLGVQSPLPRNLTLALGSGDVSPLEMVNTYATLADGGRRAEPIFIRKVVDPDGEILREDRSEPETVLDPKIAYQISSMMQSVVEEGTAKAVRELARPVAGKTGTTNEARNAWFIGFTPDLVAGVWVGFDDNRPLGPGETGGRAAIPIWLNTMKAALQDRPALEFVAPSDLVFALVDPDTGKLAPPEHLGARTEPFLPGTEPTELLETADDPERLLWEDYE
ncbi:MAG: PBP1A family penicillin-binding protein [Myxococcota bacterium]